MTPERWQQVRAVFDAVQAREPAERPRLLDELCAGDPALRAQVEQLLAADEQANREGFLPPPAAAAEPCLPGYEVLAPLGEGGMGRLWMVWHVRLERIEALKMIRPDRLANPEALRRFQAEARSAAKLGHPNIVTIYDAGEQDGAPFLIMEYVEGEDLATLVGRDGPLPVEQACDCIRQAALGLQHAFEKGIVHRDVNPSNLMRTPDGQVKILDMGLARGLPGIEPEPGPGGPTPARVVMGTPGFMAPEQALDPESADHRADVYGLGCTFTFLLTGHAPKPESLEKLPPVVPGALRAVLRQMMAPKPADRYQTPAEVVAALDPRRWAGRGRWRRLVGGRVVLGAAGCTLAALLGVMAWQAVSRARPDPGQVPTPREPPGEGERAVADITRWARVVRRDPTIPDSPIIEVDSENAAVGDAELGTLANLAGLEKLCLNGTQVSGTGLAQLRGLPHLKELDLGGMQITDAGLMQLRGLTGLEVLVLNLPGVEASDEGLASLAGLPRLQRLSLAAGRVTDRHVMHVAGLSQLRWLDLGYTHVSDRGLAHLEGLTQLEGLNLSGTPITDAGLAHLRGLTHLRELDLRDTHISDDGLAYLQGLRQLRSLCLTGTGIGDAGLAHLQGLSRLESLTVDGTKVTPAGIERLQSSLPRLTVTRERG